MAPVGEALRDGWLSLTKAQVIERAIDRLPGNTEVRSRGVQAMLTEAKRLDATDLRKLGTHLVATADPDGDAGREERELDREERTAHLNRFFSIHDDGAGGAWIKGRCSTEYAALINAHADPARRTAAPPRTGPRSTDV
jgi:hypothetical protein